MSDKTPDGQAILKQMVEGLKGVSEGPWDHDEEDSESDEGCYSSSKLMDSEGWTIADATNANSTKIVFDCDGMGGGQNIDQLAFYNFKHLARCSPDNIRAIAAHVATLQENLTASIKADGEYAAEIITAKAERDTALARVSELEKLNYVPGKLACPKCKFELISMTLHVGNGAVSADNKSDVCPNGCGPLWKVSERAEREAWTEIADKQFDEIQILTAERDAARAALEHDRSLVCDQYREIETVIQGYAWVLEGRGSYAWDDDKYRDEFKNVSSALNAALEPVKTVVKDWSNCPTDHQAITEARRDVEAERDAALARVEEFEAVLKLHHAHQLDLGTIYVKHEDSGYHEIDMTDAYSDSGLCSQTVSALKEQS